MSKKNRYKKSPSYINFAARKPSFWSSIGCCLWLVVPAAFLGPLAVTLVLR